MSFTKKIVFHFAQFVVPFFKKDFTFSQKFREKGPGRIPGAFVIMNLIVHMEFTFTS